MVNFSRFLPVAVLIALVAQGQQYATSVRALELGELVQESHQIFVGRVVGIKSGTLPEMDLGYTEYSFAVSDWIKGGTSPAITIRQLGRSGVAVGLAGLPVYKKGQEVLLFIHRPSKIGLTSPVGMQQGYYPVEKDAGGERYVRVGTMSSSIIRLRSRLQGGKSVLSGAPSTDKVLLQDFLSLVRQIR